MTDEAKTFVVRYLVARLAAHTSTASPIDFGRIEELCFLIRSAMSGELTEGLLPPVASSVFISGGVVHRVPND